MSGWRAFGRRGSGRTGSGECMNEDERQVFHVFLGACSIALVILLGVHAATYIVAAILVAGLLLVHLKLSGFPLGPLERLVQRFERPGVTPGYGAMTIAAGVLAILTLVASRDNALASLVILGFGDAASTIAGTRSRKRLPYSRKKTWGGSIAFFAACLPAAYFAGLPALAVAAIAAAAESLESGVDDNLLIAIACVVGFRLLG